MLDVAQAIEHDHARLSSPPDAALVRSFESDHRLALVAHGFGHDDSAQLALSEISRAYGQSSAPVRQRLVQALRVGDAAFRKALCGHLDREEATLCEPGATIVLAAFEGPQVQVAWAGDCRAHLIRAGAMVARTRDHSLLEQWAATSQLDSLGASEAETREKLSGIVVRAVGAGAPSKALVDPEVLTDPWVLEAGDCVLLTTPGLHRHVADARLLEVLRRHEDSSATARALVREARSNGSATATALIAFAT